MEHVSNLTGTLPAASGFCLPDLAGPASPRLSKGAVPTRTRAFETGFTLTELVITLAVAVTLTVIAIPSFNSIINSNRLTATANDLVAALNSARIEAVKRNATTQFCSNSAVSNTTDTLGTACATSTGAVFLLPTITSAAAIPVLAGVGGIVSPIQLSGTVTALRFNGQGLAQAIGANTTLYSGVVATLCTNAMSSNNRRVVSMAAGSIITTITPANSAATCP